MTRLLHAWRTIATVALALVVSAAGRAQSPLSPSPPKITMDSVLRALHAGDSAIAFATQDSARHRALDSLTTLLHEIRATDLSIGDFVSAASLGPPGYLTIFRWDRGKSGRATQAVLWSALVRLQQIVMPSTGLGPRILAQLGPAGYRTYVGAMEQLQTSAIQHAQSASTEKLHRYETKFGPGSVRLNPFETVLNYGLERVPGIGFAPTTVGGPGRLEAVATYSNTDITPNAGLGNLRILSAAHVGLRVYTFDTTSSTNPIVQLAHPGTLSFGVSAFSPTDRPLDSPLRTGRRWGGFIDWNELRIAAALGHQWRAMIGSRAQLIPHLF